MDLGSVMILGVATTIAISRLVIMKLRWWERPVIFFAAQIALLIMATLVVAIGIPEFSGKLRIVNWFLAALLVYHFVANNRRLQVKRQETRTIDPVEDALKAEIKAKIKD